MRLNLQHVNVRFYSILQLMADWNAAKKHVDDVKKLDHKGGDNLSKEVSEVMAVLCQLYVEVQ